MGVDNTPTDERAARNKAYVTRGCGCGTWTGTRLIGPDPRCVCQKGSA
jgi:hypothetical protein